MTSVAQKTLFLISSVLSLTFLCQISPAFAYSNEIIEYDISVRSINAGKGFIKFEKNTENDSYKIIASAKTTGFIKKLYNLNDTLSVFGKIKGDQLIPTSHSLILKENSYKANKTGTFDYTNDLTKYTNNLTSTSDYFVLIDSARDIFSTLYSLRQNTNLKDFPNGTSFDRTIQFVNKTVENKIEVSKELDLKISKDKSIKVRKVNITSKRIRQNPLTKDEVEKVLYDHINAEDFLESKIFKYEKDVPEQNISVIITSDSRKIPLIIEYKTRFGLFKAVATKF